ncbi:ABC transporter ATP-binding protein [Curvivirga aplysinae]|uniref:ABC transporter ATP-binding protein n=1 Tax=Curvivirga aplysinae TaxID=2529852 RepID=UPI001C3F754F|nr:ABC transporter ATP-binding protein [Curvivirga aplysinae]
MSMNFDLECKNIVKKFDSFTAVNDVSFSIPKGSFFSILGPSGCGKTTLLRMIAGFNNPDSGDIQIKGKSVLNVAPNKRPVNMVFQHLALFPMMNVAENIAYGLRRNGMVKSDIDVKVQEALERIGLPDAGSKRVDQLSGGQKQRIAIARCMVLNPDVLLLDEPLGALDLKLREHMKVELKQLQAQFDTTFVYITHDQSEALVMSDQIAVMNHGVFEQVGSPQELYYNPQTAFVAGFVGDSNRWHGRVVDLDATSVKVETESGLQMSALSVGSALKKGDDVDIFVRPESISISVGKDGNVSDENKLTGKLTNILFNGADSRCLIETETGEEISVNMPQTGDFNDLQRGTDVTVSWRQDVAKCFSHCADLDEEQ